MSIKDPFSLNSVSPDEFALILSFLRELNDPSAQQAYEQNMMRLLCRYFDFSHASFFIQDHSGNMMDPQGFRIEKWVLDRYLKKFAKYDEYYPANREDPAKPGTISFFQYSDPSTLYSQSLEELNLEAIGAITLGDGIEYQSGLGLFRPLDRGSADGRTGALKESYLPLLAPLLSQEWLYHQKMQSFWKDILLSDGTGIIIVSKRRDRLYYHNPAAALHCREFFGTPQTDLDAIHRFIKDVLAPYLNPWQEISSLSMKIRSPGGRQYLLQLAENQTEQESMCTVYISPVSQPQPSVERQRIRSIRSVFTPREYDVALLMLDGLSNQQIAEKLFISLPTVKLHIQHIFQKANVNSRAAFIADVNSGKTIL